MNTKTKGFIVAAILLIVAGIWAVKNIDFDAPQPVAQTEIPEATEAAQTETETAAQSETETEATETEDATQTEQPEETLPLESETLDFAQLVSYGKPMILDFGADACVPCQQMAPDLEAFYEENRDTATIQFYDVWKKPELVSGYPIQVVPTQLFFLPDGSAYEPSESMNDSGIRFTLYISKETDAHELTAHNGILTKEQLELILADMDASVE